MPIRNAVLVNDEHGAGSNESGTVTSKSEIKDDSEFWFSGFSWLSVVVFFILNDLLYDNSIHQESKCCTGVSLRRKELQVRAS